jgi:hypothetical protein
MSYIADIKADVDAHLCLALIQRNKTQKIKIGLEGTMSQDFRPLSLGASGHSCMESQARRMTTENGKEKKGETSEKD